MDLGDILGIWAHPDDETYLMGGIMASSIRSGHRVACITATRGEAGSQNEERWPAATIARIREAELDAALAVLGVTEHYWLDYVDGRCDEVDDETAIAKVADIVKTFQPDSILTFDPLGHTGHPDHAAVSRWATGAFERAAAPGTRLFHVAVSEEWFAEWGPRWEPFNVFAPGTPKTVPAGELAIAFEVDDEMELKLEALRAQPSQTEGLMAAMGPELFRQVLLHETFALVATK